MAKVKFELNIDAIIEAPINISSDDPIFKNPEATGKTFLFVDKMDGHMQAVYCRRAATKDNKYAQIDYYPISDNAVITDEDVKDHKHEALISHIQDCCDKILQGMVNCQNEVNIFVGKEFDGLKAEGLSTGNGISEKTLLEALKIVSKQTE